MNYSAIRDNHANGTVGDFLIGMMKVNFLKRLESSIESFEISLDRTILKIENLERKIERFTHGALCNCSCPGRRLWKSH